MNAQFLQLHARVLAQQHLIEEQITQLCTLHGGSEQVMLCNPPKSVAHLREQVQRFCTTPTTQLFALSEKESASSLFLKYSQLLLKWQEIELALLKEWGRTIENDDTVNTLTPPDAEELAIVRHFLRDQEGDYSTFTFQESKGSDS
jgi:hypothetical protein